MTKFHVNVNALGSFDTLDGARSAAQAINILLASGGHMQGGTAIWEPKAFLAHPVVPKSYDRSKVVVGTQEAEGNATKYTALIEKGRREKVEGEATASEFWKGFISESRNTGNVDLEALEALTAERIGDAEVATEVVVGAVSTVAWNEASRFLQTLKVARAKAAARK